LIYDADNIGFGSGVGSYGRFGGDSKRAVAVNELALFAGAGGGILGGLLLGWRTVCAVEIDPYCRSALLARQRDGILAPFPIWDDVCTFDGRQWKGQIDVISGGFPCQDISMAGKGVGIDGARSGLWKEYARIIDEVRPRFVFAENSPMLRSRGLDRILRDLAGLRYDATWCVLGARHVGAPHARDRIWILATCAESVGCRSTHTITNRNGSTLTRISSTDIVQPQTPKKKRPKTSNKNAEVPTLAESSLDERSTDSRRIYQTWWPMDCPAGMVDGMTNRLERVRATGNGQVPAVAALAWSILRS
jgi:DNA (cytosine-5)-methyltransferase 1